MQRVFTPGDQCIYLKIYTGIHVSDQILLKSILPLNQRLIKEKIISHWFFIRYEDSGFHLRIRIFLTDSRYWGEVISRIKIALSKYENSDLIWKIQYDTYVRELERYGILTMHLSEEYFYYNSIDVLKILKYNNTEGKEHWYYAFKMIDTILDDFNLPLPEKIKLMTELNRSFQAEFHIDYSSYHQFGKKYREIKDTIMDAMLDKTIEKILHQRNKYRRHISSQINTEFIRNKDIIINEIIKSHIHMCMNRLIQFQQRLHELIIYNSILRYYISQKIQHK